MNEFAVIFGGKGMLARAVKAELAGRGIDFVSLDLPECDLTRAADVAPVFQRFDPTLVFNCAAHTRVDACEDEQDKADAINGYAVGTLAEMAKAFNAKLVQVSTDFVFDGQGNKPYRPEDRVGPLSAYGRSKLLGERLIQQIQPRHWAIVRTAWLFGVGGASFPRTMLELGRKGTTLRVVDDQIGCPTYTEDLAAALVDVGLSRAQGIYHCTNSEPTNWYDFAVAAFDAFGEKADVQPTTTQQYLKNRPKQAPRPMYSVLDCTSLETAIGRKMRPWRETLADFRKAVDASGGF